MSWGRAQRQWLLFFLIIAISGCASAPRPFGGTTIAWRDHDRRPFAPRPEERYAPEIWDAADAMVMRPAARMFAFDTSGESLNVNAVDEVPDSSWFANRIGLGHMTPEDVAAGVCGRAYESASPPFRVVAGKVDGATAGFVVEDALGRRFVLKADRPSQPDQATAADAIGAAVYHAAGYHVPCNRVVFFAREDVQLDEGARIDLTQGEERDMTDDDLERALEAFRGTERGLRGIASQLFDGEPLGPWDYRGTWDVDLNDVIAHEDRRELRGMVVLNAWVDHWDARQHNTLSTWREHGPDGAGHVEHHLVDFGDTFGYIEGTHRERIRFGHSQFFDTQHVFEDFVGLGMVQRPWDAAERGPTWPVLGYYDVERFDPDQWRPNYWNGAFERRTERDAAWMARIIARFHQEHVRAAIALGEWSDPRVPEQLERVLMGRRARILERYLTVLSPLAAPAMHEGALCLEDLAVRSGLRADAERSHHAAAVRLDGQQIGALAVSRRGPDVCVSLPAVADYVLIRIWSRSADREATHPVDVHLAGQGGSWRIVGLERRTDGAAR